MFKKRGYWPPLGYIPPRPGACLYMGEFTGDVVECQTCSGSVKLKVFNCAVHGRCTVGRRVAGTQCCANCLDRKVVV
jgi:hypothetical protein